LQICNTYAEGNKKAMLSQGGLRDAAANFYTYQFKVYSSIAVFTVILLLNTSALLSKFGTRIAYVFLHFQSQ